MDLVVWSLNASDSIFSPQEKDAGAATCPARTLPKNLYLFGFMITGFLLIEVGGYLGFREIRRLMETRGRLPVETAYRALNTLAQALCDLSRKHDALVSKWEAQWSIEEDRWSKMETMSDSMKAMGNTLEKLVVLMEGN